MSIVGQEQIHLVIKVGHNESARDYVTLDMGTCGIPGFIHVDAKDDK